jgi:hypothetical protein
MIYNRDMCGRALERLRNSPGALDEEDLHQLSIFGGEATVLEGLEARKAALSPPLRSPLATLPRGKSFTHADCELVVDALVDLIKAWVGPLAQRIVKLEQDRSKGVSGVRWRGVYKRAETYRSGELLTHDGSLWVVLAPETAQVPGRPPEGQAADYQLIVKQGAVPK